MGTVVRGDPAPAAAVRRRSCGVSGGSSWRRPGSSCWVVAVPLPPAVMLGAALPATPCSSCPCHCCPRRLSLPLAAGSLPIKTGEAPSHAGGEHQARAARLQDMLPGRHSGRPESRSPCESAASTARRLQARLRLRDPASTDPPASPCRLPIRRQARPSVKPEAQRGNNCQGGAPRLTCIGRKSKRKGGQVYEREVCYSLWRSYERSTDFGVGLPAFPPLAPGHPTSPQKTLLWGQKWAEGVRDPVA